VAALTDPSEAARMLELRFPERWALPEDRPGRSVEWPDDPDLA